MIQVPPGRSLLSGNVDWPLIVTAAAVILAVAALFSIWLGRLHSPRAKLVWTAIVLVVPIAGPLLWYALGRERKRGE
ncbi:MAG TPA: PLD nuclease N-terminal domain-containing protein [Gemmatimonadaceae bacterium]|nr:PLD nuclease N-terminal domain-containing protein [Gemmatimonadaceae bacterium]